MTLSTNHKLWLHKSLKLDFFATLTNDSTKLTSILSDHKFWSDTLKSYVSLCDEKMPRNLPSPYHLWAFQVDLLCSSVDDTILCCSDLCSCQRQVLLALQDQIKLPCCQEGN
ncbi:unnamed protein product [Microthlaspi erraticum]|uniref:Uncharacterized protein n=1 Tax=Microthlaspi erraticum TaxID=1685480 RepID=A0A6D2K0I9_9BRAS|nr:unnamed protein product [Microthlaspi erraticum]